MKSFEAWIREYLAGEAREGAVFVGVGLAALAVSAWLLGRRSPYRATAIPLVAIAAVEIAVGATIYLRTDRQVAGPIAQVQAVPAAFQRDELARLERVLAGFRVYRVVEAGVLGVGPALVGLGRARPARRAAGLGCIVQAVVLLVLDGVAQRRAEAYREVVRQLL